MSIATHTPLRYAQIPERFNVATHFLDRNLEARRARHLKGARKCEVGLDLPYLHLEGAQQVHDCGRHVDHEVGLPELERHSELEEVPG